MLCRRILRNHILIDHYKALLCGELALCVSIKAQLAQHSRFERREDYQRLADVDGRCERFLQTLAVTVDDDVDPRRLASDARDLLLRVHLRQHYYEVRLLLSFGHNASGGFNRIDKLEPCRRLRGGLGKPDESHAYRLRSRLSGGNLANNERTWRDEACNLAQGVGGYQPVHQRLGAYAAGQLCFSKRCREVSQIVGRDICNVDCELAVSLDYPVILDRHVRPDPAVRAALVGHEVAGVHQQCRYLL